MNPRKRKQDDECESQSETARRRKELPHEAEETGDLEDRNLVVVAHDVVGRGQETPDPFTQYLYDDVFIHFLRFIVSASGLVDGDTFRSATAVSKRWHALTNRPELWTISDGNVDNSLRRSLPSRPSPWIREKMTKSNPFFNLIGFVNLGRKEGNDYEYDEPGDVLYKVRERATGKHFLLTYHSKGKNDEALRELANLHRIHGQEFLTVGGEEDSGWQTPIGAELCHGKIMLWYPWYDRTLEQLYFYEQPLPPVTNETIKRWLRGILRLLATVHERGIALSNIFATYLRLRNCAGDDMSQSMLVLRCPRHDVSWCDNKPILSHRLVALDVNCVGHVLKKMIEGRFFYWDEAGPDGKASCPIFWAKIMNLALLTMFRYHFRLSCARLSIRIFVSGTALLLPPRHFPMPFSPQTKIELCLFLHRCNRRVLGLCHCATSLRLKLLPLRLTLIDHICGRIIGQSSMTGW
jgi:hypothetical protein